MDSFHCNSHLRRRRRRQHQVGTQSENTKSTLFLNIYWLNLFTSFLCFTLSLQLQLSSIPMSLIFISQGEKNVHSDLGWDPSLTGRVLYRLSYLAAWHIISPMVTKSEQWHTPSQGIFSYQPSLHARSPIGCQMSQGEKNVQSDRGSNPEHIAYRASALLTKLSGCLTHYYYYNKNVAIRVANIFSTTWPVTLFLTPYNPVLKLDIYFNSW